MNKKELIEKIESLPSLTSITSIRPYIDKKVVLGLISQLDEPQKVKVPQFVADWIEEAKDECYTILGATNKAPKGSVDGWLELQNIEIFTQAWVNGYEVEKEKRYLVKIKNIDTNSAYLKHQLQNNHWYWGSLTECGAFSPFHTKKELEAAGFGWVFDCEGVEIEELEDE